MRKCRLICALFPSYEYLQSTNEFDASFSFLSNRVTSLEEKYCCTNCRICADVLWSCAAYAFHNPSKPWLCDLIWANVIPWYTSSDLINTSQANAEFTIPGIVYHCVLTIKSFLSLSQNRAQSAKEHACLNITFASLSVLPVISLSPLFFIHLQNHTSPCKSRMFHYALIFPSYIYGIIIGCCSHHLAPLFWVGQYDHNVQMPYLHNRSTQITRSYKRHTCHVLCALPHVLPMPVYCTF